MIWLNYNHLFYFWTVAREGSVVAASEKLGLTQPTISAQLKILEDNLGETLFNRSGRSLTLTARGELVYRYADEIFSLGRQMLGALGGESPDCRLKLRVGISESVVDSIALVLLRPFLDLDPGARLVCFSGHRSQLLSKLLLREIDLVVADEPVGQRAHVRAFNHELGSSEVGLFGAAGLAKKVRTNFPESLNGMPLLMPAPGAPVRRAIEAWFDRRGILPRIVGEFEPAALQAAFGREQLGLFCAPTVVGSEIQKWYDVQQLAVLDGVTERFYAISLERRISHPGIERIVNVSSEVLFDGRCSTRRLPDRKGARRA